MFGLRNNELCRWDMNNRSEVRTVPVPYIIREMKKKLARTNVRPGFHIHREYGFVIGQAIETVEIVI
jgi:hypothetical protein